MQAWDQVQVIGGGDHDGEAGLVVKVEGDDVTVKLDTSGEEVVFVAIDLRLLGR